MLVKTSELQGAALDWAVSEAEECSYCDYMEDGPINQRKWSTDWAQGVPIIDREGINLRAIRKPGHPMDGEWLAAYDHGNTGSMVHWVKRTDWHKHYFRGPTLLIAAMRCFVASKLGEEVEVPDEILCK